MTSQDDLTNKIKVKKKKAQKYNTTKARKLKRSIGKELCLLKRIKKPERRGWNVSTKITKYLNSKSVYKLILKEKKGTIMIKYHPPDKMSGDKAMNMKN